MKVIVCGGRNFTNYKFLNSTLDAFHAQTPITCLVHGDARGADRGAARWAFLKGIPVIPYPADWQRYGDSAGTIRNGLMLAEENPDAVIAFPGGSGTKDMKRITKRAKIPLFEFDPDFPEVQNIEEFLT